MLSRIAVLSTLLVHVFSLPHVHDVHARDEPPVRRALPDTWYHPEDHPVRALFKRDAAAPSYPAVGSAAWIAAYPTGPPEAKIPDLWTQALAKAQAAGQIPDIPQTTTAAPTTYEGLNSQDPNICGNSCRAPDDIWDAPNGTMALSFDDGPLPPAEVLYDYLQQNNQRATHFYIGSNILQYPNLFTMAYSRNKDDIAVHTWTHPHMCTLTNQQVLAEIGWTMQIIHDSTGGRVPRYWRPPYGEVDNRVRAIAKYVYGLTTVIWNNDTDDWNIGTNEAITVDSVNANFQKWLNGPQSPGLVVLEHELTNDTVKVFMDNYELAKSKWKIQSIPEIFGKDWYQNSADDNAPVALMEVAGTIAPLPTPTPTNITTSSTPTPTPTGAGTIMTLHWGTATIAMTLMLFGLLL